MTAIFINNLIGPVPIDCVIRERPSSELEITSNPIESGSTINDNAIVKPTQLTIEIANNYAAVSYNALLLFQRAREPFTIVTGLTIYENMLIKSINTDRDKNNANILHATLDLHQIDIVDTANVPVDVSDIGDTPPGKPGGVKSTRAAIPSSNRSGDTETADRAAGTTQKGDAVTKTVNSSILRDIFL